MPRERKPRTWVRLDCEGVLRGSINYLLPLDGQAVWVKMIAYSEVCSGRAGFIEDNNHNGLPHDYIAQELHCPLDLFETVLKTMADDGAIKTNGTGSIELVNFKHYQFSEYDRQKIYRQKEGEGKQTFEEYVEAIKKDYADLDVEGELKKFHLWWDEGRKELKRPKSAFRNWLDKARIFKNEDKTRNGTHQGNNSKVGQSSRHTKGDSQRDYRSGKYEQVITK